MFSSTSVSASSFPLSISRSRSNPSEFILDTRHHSSSFPRSLSLSLISLNKCVPFFGAKFCLLPCCTVVYLPYSMSQLSSASTTVTTWQTPKTEKCRPTYLLSQARLLLLPGLSTQSWCTVCTTVLGPKMAKMEPLHRLS